MGDNTETYTDFIAEYFVKTEIGQIRKKYWKPPKIQIYPSSDGVLGCLERKPINSTQVAKQICFAVKCAKSISYLANIFISMCSLSIQLHLNKILIESVDWEAYYSIDNFLAGKSLYLVWINMAPLAYDVTRYPESI